MDTKSNFHTQKSSEGNKSSSQCRKDEPTEISVETFFWSLLDSSKIFQLGVHRVKNSG